MATIRTLFRGDADADEPAALIPGLFLLRNAEEWDSHWRLMSRDREPAPVSWDTELVLLLVLGVRPTAGYHVTIEDVVGRVRRLEAHAVEQRPGGFTGPMRTVPVHAVAIPAAGDRDELTLIQRIVITG